MREKMNSGMSFFPIFFRNYFPKYFLLPVSRSLPLAVLSVITVLLERVRGRARRSSWSTEF
jgi:hypothetical protein